jgi:hypothetical protein
MSGRVSRFWPIWPSLSCDPTSGMQPQQPRPTPRPQSSPSTCQPSLAPGSRERASSMGICSRLGRWAMVPTGQMYHLARNRTRHRRWVSRWPARSGPAGKPCSLAYKRWSRCLPRPHQTRCSCEHRDTEGPVTITREGGVVTNAAITSSHHRCSSESINCVGRFAGRWRSRAWRIWSSGGLSGTGIARQRYSPPWIRLGRSPSLRNILCVVFDCTHRSLPIVYYHSIPGLDRELAGIMIRQWRRRALAQRRRSRERGDRRVLGCWYVISGQD